MKRNLELVINCDALMIMIVITEHWYFNIEANYLKLMVILISFYVLRRHNNIDQYTMQSGIQYTRSMLK